MPLERLDHVLVLTDDIEATRAFYCDALGFEAGERPSFAFSGYWLYLGGAPCVHVADRSEYEEEARRVGLPVGPAVDHVAFGGRDYDELVARLERAGVAAVANEVPGGALRQLYVTDPNGVRVELNVPGGPKCTRKGTLRVMSKTVPMRELRGELSRVIDQVADLREHVIVTRRGRPAAVLVPVDEYEALEETAEILSDPATVDAIEDGLREAERGETVTLADLRWDLRRRDRR